MKNSPLRPKHIFGPVPSRRLGISLGVDLVPYKTCTFDCIYCELGRTTIKTVELKSYVSPKKIYGELEFTLSALKKKPDYITISGSGEPTLNNNIREIICNIKETTSTPVAVLTNGSLFSIDKVRENLLGADIVLPSLDAITPTIFEYINRPHPSLKIERIISGLIQFRKQYQGQIWLEILFCRGVNDSKDEIKKLKETIKKISPDRIQLNTSVRPPVEDFVFPLIPEQLEEIKVKFGRKAEVIPDFAAPLGNLLDTEKDIEIINLLRRRPCTAEDISKSLGLHIDEAVKRLGNLSKEGTIHYRIYQDRCYYEN